MDNPPPILLTGFLGIGKTTLLNDLLKAPECAKTLVLIIELGEEVFDHRLVDTCVENAVVPDKGCLCCTVLGALSGSLQSLYWQRHDKKIAHFDHITIATTRVADRAPILHDDQLAGVVTCVDALFADVQLSEQPEACKQAILADLLFLTNTDLVCAEIVAALSERLVV